MIGLLTGRLAAASLGEVVLEVGGVGYRVHVPPGSLEGSVGETVTLHTHLSVREDSLTLYGFADPATRDLFETLLGVTGVGPKLALAAVGTMGADGLRRAVVGEDVAALTVVPGVGRKGAQRMILELRERLGPEALEPAGVPGAVAGEAVAADPRTEVREALASLGYAAAEVQRALDGLEGEEDGSPEELLRRALQRLGSRA
ncbi:Holliday junction branch migration protein RuvA [Egibacter rhizosphaerae]|uniref:Holliday junction branch migration complex subunit RuvA n=1 Tax=Egibacter rhizosphaerae TaxID=1670831 RepID=A0A411YJU3_9ACTN|nr:Holliday junction branch migration protein RuvA [Egibacter rhizosphaerae]QBI21466.1 Holliday junction branch migration protein RuvA [Egibacter rhizosphaerae]